MAPCISDANQLYANVELVWTWLFLFVHFSPFLGLIMSQFCLQSQSDLDNKTMTLLLASLLIISDACDRCFHQGIPPRKLQRLGDGFLLDKNDLWQEEPSRRHNTAAGKRRKSALKNGMLPAYRPSPSRNGHLAGLRSFGLSSERISKIHLEFCSKSLLSSFFPCD